MNNHRMPKMSNHETAESKDETTDKGSRSGLSEGVYISVHEGAAPNVAQQHERVPTMRNHRKKDCRWIPRHDLWIRHHWKSGKDKGVPQNFVRIEVRQIDVQTVAANRQRIAEVKS